jgi:hypothetical protein
MAHCNRSAQSLEILFICSILVLLTKLSIQEKSLASIYEKSKPLRPFKSWFFPNLLMLSQSVSFNKRSFTKAANKSSTFAGGFIKAKTSFKAYKDKLVSRPLRAKVSSA